MFDLRYRETGHPAAAGTVWGAVPWGVDWGVWTAQRNVIAVYGFDVHVGIGGCSARGGSSGG